MKDKKIKIIPPEGYEIDKENSTFECIKFKPIVKTRWIDNPESRIKGYFINNISGIYSTISGINDESNYNVFATQMQAESALAMARLSQIIANDERFGGPIADEEWNNISVKYCIERVGSHVSITSYTTHYIFLAFHTREQRDLFLEENLQLIKKYFML